MPPGRERSVCTQDQDLRLPKPIYEALPFFLIAVGALFVFLSVDRYEYAPTLIIMLLGFLCIMGGILLVVLRVIYRTRSVKEEGD